MEHDGLSGGQACFDGGTPKRGHDGRDLALGHDGHAAGANKEARMLAGELAYGRALLKLNEALQAFDPLPTELSKSR